MAKLTEKQENFALEYVLNGGNATAAYRKCYDVGEGTREATVWNNAHVLLKHSEVSARVDEFRKEKFSLKVMSIEERKALLTEWATAGDAKAIDMLNKMDGAYAPEKVEHSGEVVRRTINVNPTKKK